MELPDVDPKYTQMCSKHTLQEEDKGFFNELVRVFIESSNIMKFAEEMCITKMAAGDYITALLNQNDIFSKLMNIFQINPTYRKKCPEIATKLRKQAGKELSYNNFQRALNLCNQAIVISPLPGGEPGSLEETSLPLSLWLRSECLIRMNKLELALRDLQTAIKLNHPVNYRGMLFHHQAECYKKMGEPMKAKISYELSLKLSPYDQLTEQKIREEIKKLESDMKNKEDGQGPSTSSSENVASTSKGPQKYEEIQSCLEIDQKSGMGRYAVAKKDISIGQILIAEEPYVACLKYSSFGTHCHHCFERLQASYACPNCANLAFCSPKCRDAALETYHKYECRFMDLFMGSGMSVLCYMALRMVTQQGLDKSLHIYKRYFLQQNKQCYDNEYDRMNVKDKEMLIYNLCTHTNLRTTNDYIHRTLMAFFLFRCLQKSGFFSEDTSIYDLSTTCNNLSSEEVGVIVLLLHHIQILQFNAHEIEEVQQSDLQKVKTFKPRSIAVGLYPTVALFNHSCYQGVGRYFVGKKIVMRTLKPLTKGEMIPENYGPSFAKRTKYARQRTLRSRYWFHCECKACVEIWPNMEQVTPNKAPALRCPKPSCKGKINIDKPKDKLKCPSCEHVITSDFVGCMVQRINVECIKKYEEGEKLMRSQKIEQAIQVLISGLKTFNEIAHPPHDKTQIAEQNLKNCFNVSQFV